MITQITAQSSQELFFDPKSEREIQIIDAGVPTSRAIREVLSMLPPGAALHAPVCVNPFDLTLCEEFDAIQRVGCADRRSKHAG